MPKRRRPLAVSKSTAICRAICAVLVGPMTRDTRNESWRANAVSIIVPDGCRNAQGMTVRRRRIAAVSGSTAAVPDNSQLSNGVPPLFFGADIGRYSTCVHALAITKIATAIVAFRSGILIQDIEPYPTE